MQQLASPFGQGLKSAVKHSSNDKERPFGPGITSAKFKFAEKMKTSFQVSIFSANLNFAEVTVDVTVDGRKDGGRILAVDELHEGFEPYLADKPTEFQN